MAATNQHACNRKLDTAPSIFKHDTNNVTAVEKARSQRKRMEGAATELKNATEERRKIQLEIEELRLAVERKDAKVEQIQIELRETKQNAGEKLRKFEEDTQKERQIALNQKKDEHDKLQGEYSSLTNQNNELQKKYNSTLKEQRDQESQIAALNLKLPTDNSENCLPGHYHGAEVKLFSLGSLLAMDAGKDSGIMIHAWEHNTYNQNHVFKLEKVGGVVEPHIPWIIKFGGNDKKRLYLESGGNHEGILVGDCSDEKGYWHIGRGSNKHVGSWVIMNRKWNTFINTATDEKKNGVLIWSDSATDNTNQNWIIVPISFKEQ